ncbi:hypothetical protein AX16_008843 [Volvariella volvacea WC 439]|nr:hypothetical protein AX16_008843 [Volvariella volvacea WC 439]
MRKELYLALTVRVLIALLTRTFFQPDEYFQSLEPAHHLVFGYGHLTWEWLAPKPIRSVIYPALNVPVYYLLKITGLADLGILGRLLVVLGPRLVHGTIAAAADIWTYKLAQKIVGRDYAGTALFLSLMSFFNALALSRSLSNSLETTLTTVAFTYYPWDASPKLAPQLIFYRPKIWIFILFSALACAIRPTNSVIWIFLYGNIFWSLKSSRTALRAMVGRVVLSAFLTLSSVFVIDTLYYTKITLTPLNFLSTNLSSVSLFYGTSNWHYYITQGLPILTTIALPFVLHGTKIAFSLRDTTLRTVFWTIAWTVAIYSLGGHKEWRFIHPILPLLYILAAKSLVDLSSVLESEPTPQAKIPGSEKKRIYSSKVKHIRPATNHLPFPLSHLPLRSSFIYSLLLQLPVSLYVVLLYCDAPITVMSYLRSLPSSEIPPGRGNVGFLMPCHSTPGHAYLHRPELANGELWALGCEPPLQNQNLSTYADQTDVFFYSPKIYLETYFPAHVNTSFPPSPLPVTIPGTLAPVSSPKSLCLENKRCLIAGYPWKHEWPRRLIFFGALLKEEGVQELLESKGYVEEWKAGREWEGEDKRKGGVRVWTWAG